MVRGEDGRGHRRGRPGDGGGDGGGRGRRHGRRRGGGEGGGDALQQPRRQLAQLDVLDAVLQALDVANLR